MQYNWWWTLGATPSFDSWTKDDDSKGSLLKKIIARWLAYHREEIKEGLNETEWINQMAQDPAFQAAVLGSATPLMLGGGTFGSCLGGTLAGLDLATTTYHYGSIAHRDGVAGLRQEVQEHPVLAALDLFPFVPKVRVSNILASVKGMPHGSNVPLVRVVGDLGQRTKGAGATVRKGMDPGEMKKMLWAKHKEGVFRKDPEYIIQGEPQYEILKDIDCLKKGDYIRFDAAGTHGTSGPNPHAHFEVRKNPDSRKPDFECYYEDGKFVRRSK